MKVAAWCGGVILVLMSAAAWAAVYNFEWGRTPTSIYCAPAPTIVPDATWWAANKAKWVSQGTTPMVIRNNAGADVVVHRGCVFVIPTATPSPVPSASPVPTATP
jgi:hypothetical protein